MAYEFLFPDVGEGIHEGKIVEWLVKVGDSVKEDDVLARVETDKAVVEIPSPKTGVVLKLGTEAGEIIHVGEVFAVIGKKGEKVKAAGKPSKAEAVTSSAEETAPEPEEEPKKKARRPLATPHTRAFARKMGVDLTTVTGSGRGGRITDEDVERAAQGGPVTAPPAFATAPAAALKTPAAPREITTEGPVERLPLSHLRKVIADNMSLSKQTSAHVTHVDEADVTELYARYKGAKAGLAAEGGVKLSLLPFFMKAIVTVLKEYPLLNASYDEAKGEIVLKKYYNLGIAVDTDEGLIVPVVKGVENKGILELAGEIADLAERARNRQLKLDELQQGTFTITNIGPIGGLFATPIIRQPELAIVGLHTIKDRPAVVDGEIVVRKMMYLSVSFDHRIIDGAEAARFMSDLAALVSNPDLLMVKL